MTVARLVPLADLNLRAQIDENDKIVGFVDDQGQAVILTVTSATGQLLKQDGTYTAFRSDVLPVNSVAPAITGAGTHGVEHTVSDGTWTGADNVYTYQWKLDGVAIAAATTAAYTPLVGQLGSDLTCTVTATNPAGAASAASAAVTVIAPV